MPAIRLEILMRNRFNQFIRSGKSARSIFEFSRDQLVTHIERQFCDGMDWAAFGRGEIHIDHIVPLSSFDSRDPEQVRRAWAITNLRPLWAIDNKRKKNKRLFLI